MFAKLSALAALFVASVTAFDLTVPDQANWGSIITVNVTNFADGADSVTFDLLLNGVSVQRQYIIGYQYQAKASSFKVVIPPVVDLGEQYQFFATELDNNPNNLYYGSSNNITIN